MFTGWYTLTWYNKDANDLIRWENRELLSRFEENRCKQKLGRIQVQLINLGEGEGLKREWIQEENNEDSGSFKGNKMQSEYTILFVIKCN